MSDDRLDPVAYAKRVGYRTIVTDEMIDQAIADSPARFNVRELVQAIARRHNRLVSEYLVSLHLHNRLLDRRLRCLDEKKDDAFAYEVVA